MEMTKSNDQQGTQNGHPYFGTAEKISCEQRVVPLAGCTALGAFAIAGGILATKVNPWHNMFKQLKPIPCRGPKTIK